MAVYRAPGEWTECVASLASVLDERSRWRLLPLMWGMLFASGRRTVPRVGSTRSRQAYSVSHHGGAVATEGVQMFRAETIAIMVPRVYKSARGWRHCRGAMQGRRSVRG